MGICHISHCQSICPCSEPFSESTRSIDRLHVVTQPTCDRQNSPVTQRHHRISQQTTKLSRDSDVVTMIRYIVDGYTNDVGFLFLDLIKHKCILIFFYMHRQFITVDFAQFKSLFVEIIINKIFSVFLYIYIYIYMYKMYIYCTENFTATYLLKERPKLIVMHIHQNHN